MTDEELLEAYADGYWEKAPIVTHSDGDPHIAGLREVEKRARVVPEVTYSVPTVIYSCQDGEHCRYPKCECPSRIERLPQGDAG